MSIAKKIEARIATLRAMSNAELADACKKAVSMTMNGEEFEVARERMEAAGQLIGTGVLRKFQFQSSLANVHDFARLEATLTTLRGL